MALLGPNNLDGSFFEFCRDVVASHREDREEQERLAGRMAAVIALREAQVSGNEVRGYMRRRRCVRWPRILRPPLSRFILAIVQTDLSSTSFCISLVSRRATDPLPVSKQTIRLT